MNRKLEGVLVIDKETGPTSHDVIAAMRSIIGMRKIGHCGTLDPLASGVLVACLGGFTRLNPWLSEGEKEYDATFQLGGTSDTYDAQGTMTPTADGVIPTRSQVEEAVRRFVGTIEQIPPAYSALKVDGVRSYKLARQNRIRPLNPRRVRIRSIVVREYEYPALFLEIVCARGTYIRSLASDLGKKLGCGAYVAALRRTRVGRMGLDLALSLAQLQSKVDGGQIEQHFVDPSFALHSLRSVVLEKPELGRFANGNFVSPGQIGGDESVSAESVELLTCAVYDHDMQLCGIGEWDRPQGRLRPVKVFRQTADEPAL